MASTVTLDKPNIPFAPAVSAVSRVDADDTMPDESVVCVEDANRAVATVMVTRTEIDAETMVTSTACVTTPAAEAKTFCMIVRSVAPKLEASPDKVKRIDIVLED